MQVNGAVVDSASIQKDPEAIIYVSAGAIVAGTSQFSNARIVEILGNSPSKKILKEKTTNTGLAKQIVAKKEANDQSLKLLQEKINKKVKNSFYSSSQESELVRFAKSKLDLSAVTSAASSFKFAHAFVSITFLLNVHRAQILKQKYCTSLSYLQFGKFRSSSLRAPPAFL